MKQILLFFFLLYSGLFWAQIPDGYYDGTENLSGYELKTKLSQITGQGYHSNSYGSLWTFYKDYETDRYYENDGTLLDIYSEDPTDEDPYNFTLVTDQCGSSGYSKEGDCYNREHLMPQSWFKKGMPMRTDVHHIFPTDGYVNAIHGNMPFGEVSNPNYVSLNGSKRGSNAYDYPNAYTGEVFEPIDEFKGDIARAYLYMATRYEDKVAGWKNSNSGSQNTFNGTSDQAFNDWTLDMLLKWHHQDPVSQREIDRNNAAYAYQGNRNPFVDHPEFVNMIWRPEETLPADNLFEEDFNDCELVAGTFMIFSEMSEADWTCSSNAGEYQTGGMEMNAMVNGENDPSIDWLITANSMDFTAYKELKLSFFTSSKYGNTPLQVLYSVNYDGEGNPSLFDWYTIPDLDIPTHQGNANAEINLTFSDVDISSLAQHQFYLAFRYDNSNGQDPTLWVVDNIKIDGVDKEMGTDPHHTLEVVLYPNPSANGLVNVSLPDGKDFSYEIYDMLGRSIKRGNAQGGNLQLPVSSWQKGMYMMRIQTDAKQTTKQFIVQ